MIVPAYTFPATANAVELVRRPRPVLVDVDPDTFNIDLANVAAAVTPRTKAVVAVHSSAVRSSGRSWRRPSPEVRSSRTLRARSARATAAAPAALSG